MIPTASSISPRKTPPNALRAWFMPLLGFADGWVGEGVAMGSGVS